ncbi:HrpE/YscL family type III secretion apparatus protein [Pseudomonas soli]|uniref:HrpE/YscL family type III secretion apparatus protein n=1 Tax=Pseudomonas soli TaxID=1306993 RepID=UPI003D0147A9
MLPFIELNDCRPMVEPGCTVLRSADYQRFLEAGALIESARQRASELDAQADAVLEAQHRLGHEVGLEMAAIEQAAMLHSVRLRCAELYRQADRQLSEVVYQAVGKVLGAYPDIELTLAATRQALAQVQPCEALVLHVCPEQVREVRLRIDAILEQFPDTGPLEICGDARLARGGCRLETAGCVIDASIEGQLSALQRVLEQGVADNEAGSP